MKKVILITFLSIFFVLISALPAFAEGINCNGAMLSDPNIACPTGCSAQSNIIAGTTYRCCGWWGNVDKTQCSAVEVTPLGQCAPFEADNQDKIPPTTSCACGAWQYIPGGWCCGNKDSHCTSIGTPGIFEAPSAGFLQQLNLTVFGGLTKQFVAFQTPRGIISYLLPFLFTLAGLILFVMLVWGGFEMLTGAADPKSQQAGQQRITAAIIGFLIIFAAYWIAQLLQTIFGISILG